MKPNSKKILKRNKFPNKQENNDTTWSEFLEILQQFSKETTSLQFSKFLDKTLETNSTLEQNSFEV
jgi:hypothetical protein